MTRTGLVCSAVRNERSDDKRVRPRIVKPPCPDVAAPPAERLPESTGSGQVRRPARLQTRPAAREPPGLIEIRLDLRKPGLRPDRPEFAQIDEGVFEDLKAGNDRRRGWIYLDCKAIIRHILKSHTDRVHVNVTLSCTDIYV